MGRGATGFDGLEGWQPWRPTAAVCCWCLLSTVAAGCALVLSFDVIHEVRERGAWRDKVSGMDRRAPCRVTAWGEVEERDKPQYEHDIGCEGEPCPVEYRAWIAVTYNLTGADGSPAGGAAVSSKCWAHVDDSWEEDRGAVDLFLQRYATQSAVHDCCYNPAEEESVRFCGWDVSACYICGKSFWIPVGVLIVWALVTVARLTARWWPCLDQYAAGPDWQDEIDDGPIDVGDEELLP
eukprot:TRINITY_DN72219_c0_g1_i1.p2 TRINITY_DN72219_c0_g1~~TRINITY_DN72219_c0_g1_i1.p2  ORF type:complete len:237 (+),score=82.03 TRINITY_DN72219_c0_g1_i1:78-788(+)